MKLHPNPEPTTPVRVVRYVEMPRCPAQNRDGSQCQRSISTGSPVDVRVGNETVTVCATHGKEVM